MSGIERRAFISLLAGAAVASPLAARAQQGAKIPRIGCLLTGSLEWPETRATLDAFRQGLRVLGYVEGQSIVTEYRTAEGKIERFPSLANELVALKLDLILAAGTPAASAVQRATTTIPIVAPAMGDPVADGLVGSLARPGGNVTGLAFLGPELAAKRLGLLKQALPNASRVAALWHPGAFAERTRRDMLQCGEPTSSTAPSPRRPQVVLTRSSCCRAQSFSTRANASSTLLRSIGCPRCAPPGNLRPPAAS